MRAKRAGRLSEDSDAAFAASEAKLLSIAASGCEAAVYRTERSEGAVPASEARLSNTRQLGGEMKTLALKQMPTDGPSVIEIGSFWKSRVKETFGVHRQLTPKEFGQLKMLRRDLGAATCPVIHRIIGNWQAFCSKASENAGVPCTPPTPHIGFLLAHCATAVNLLHTIAKKAGDTYFLSELDDVFEQWEKTWKVQ
jgi:hypothetical protein